MHIYIYFASRLTTVLFGKPGQYTSIELLDSIVYIQYIFA